MAWFKQELAENAVATVADFASIMFAYTLGVYQLGIAFGVAYAAFVAYLVIWLRKPLTRGTRRFLNIFRRSQGRSETNVREVE
ncbi:MAG: hypothetical protein HYU03_05025 [Thaumarchaeota archaeon]|nr:hypothetical protein [Nitrososphaerota archaeon]